MVDGVVINNGGKMMVEWMVIEAKWWLKVEFGTYIWYLDLNPVSFSSGLIPVALVNLDLINPVFLFYQEIFKILMRISLFFFLVYCATCLRILIWDFIIYNKNFIREMCIFGNKCMGWDEILFNTYEI